MKKPATKDTASDLIGGWKVWQIGALQGLGWWERDGLLKRRFFAKLTKYCEKTCVSQNLVFNCKGLAMTTTLKIQKQLLKTADAVEQIQAEVESAIQTMLDTNTFYKLFEVEGEVHPYYKLKKMAVDTHTAVYRFFKSVLDWQMNGKTLRTQLEETRAKDIVANGIGEETVIELLRTLTGSAKPAKVAAQYLLSAYETAASLANCSQPQTVRVDLLRADMMRGSIKGIQPFERKLHSKCDAVRKELIKLSKVIRQVDRNGTTIELALQTQQTLLLLKNQNTGAIGGLLK